MKPRTLRPVPDPLGSYVRPSGRDHKVILEMLVAGRPVGTGIVADPVLGARQRDLRVEARRQGLEVIMDPRTLELSTVGGWERSGVSDLPWAGSALHKPSDFEGLQSRLFLLSLVAAVEEGGYTAVFAPTHFIAGIESDWLPVDGELTIGLREELDRRGLEDVLIYYPLISKAASFKTPASVDQLISHLERLPVDGVWLRLHPFGSSSGPLALRSYLELCRRLHAVNRPLIADHTGTIGVSLLAFGAVGGIESGVTMNERTNLTGYLNPPKEDGKPFSPAARVYLHEIGAFLAPKLAEGFFETRGMKSAHGCTDTTCCRRGWKDMQLDPRRHFLHHRASEIIGLGTMPDSLRPGQYLEKFLRPATDKAIRAAEVEPSLTAARKRLEGWRGTLSRDLEVHSAFTVSAPAAGKRLRRSA